MSRAALAGDDQDLLAEQVGAGHSALTSTRGVGPAGFVEGGDNSAPRAAGDSTMRVLQGDDRARNRGARPDPRGAR